MWRWTKRILAGFVGLLIVGALAGASYEALATRRDLAATPPPGTMVDVGGHRLHLWCTGAGVPTVILENGLGGTTAAWGFVQPEIARFTRVCSYDRAGSGYSDPGPSPRTARQMANELAALLELAGVGHAVVVAAASSGGLNARVFASDHAHRVAGLVLVDASHENQLHEVPRIARFVPLLSSLGIFRLLGVSFGLSADSLPPSTQGFEQATRFRAAGYRAAAGEITHMRETAEQVRSSRRKLTIPVVVVTGARGADGTWGDLQRDQVALSEIGCQMIAERAGHLVAIDRPDVVVDAIRAIVERTRGRANVPLCGSESANRQ